MMFSQYDIRGLAGFGAMLCGIGLMIVGVFAMSFAAFMVGVIAILATAFIFADKKERTEALWSLPFIALFVGLAMYDMVFGLYFLGGLCLMAFLICLFRYPLWTILCIVIGLKI